MLRPYPPNPPHPHPIGHHIIIKTPPAGVAEGVQGSGHHKYGSGLLTLQGSDAQTNIYVPERIIQVSSRTDVSVVVPVDGGFDVINVYGGEPVGCRRVSLSTQ